MPQTLNSIKKINHSIVEQVFKPEETTCKELILEGTKAIDGADAKLEFKCDITDSPHFLPDTTDDGKVDYKNAMKISTIIAGEGGRIHTCNAWRKRY